MCHTLSSFLKQKLLGITQCITFFRLILVTFPIVDYLKFNKYHGSLNI